jgi:hypothetical protein
MEAGESGETTRSCVTVPRVSPAKTDPHRSERIKDEAPTSSV